MSMHEMCDFCYKPVAHVVQDLKETWPVRDANGAWWKTWEVNGAPHYLCVDHYTPSKLLYLSYDEIRRYIETNEPQLSGSALPTLARCIDAIAH